MKRYANMGERIKASAEVNETTGCWEWRRSRWNGYGRVSIYRPDLRQARSQLAHRVAYETFVGPIPDGLTIDHLCRNRACVNPDHLEPVTLQENLRRADGVGAVNARKTHCHLGHEFTPENTYHPPKHPDRRHCRTCVKAAGDRYYQRRLTNNMLGGAA